MKNFKGFVSLNCLYFWMCVIVGILGILISLFFKQPVGISLSFVVLFIGSLFFGIRWVFGKRLKRDMSCEVVKKEESFPRRRLILLLLCIILFTSICFCTYYLLEKAHVQELLLRILNLEN